MAAQAADTSVSSGVLLAPGTPVGMQEMIESIRATIEIAARQRATQARIALHPQELGHINIRLSQTSEGLLARVSAETTAAAQALIDGRSELQQSLSSLGVSLLRLDIGTFGQSLAGGGGGERSFADRATHAGVERVRASSEDGESPDPATGEAQSASPAAIAGGELVDVLA